MAQTTSRDFNGSSQYASKTTGGIPVSSLPFTFASWVYMDAQPADGGGFNVFDVSGATDSTRRIFELHRSGANVYLRHGAYSTTNGWAVSDNTGKTVSTTTWIHVVLIVNSATSITLCANGDWANRLDDTIASYSNANFTSVTLASQNGGAAYLDGKLAHGAVWNSALSQSDVESLAAGANPQAVQNAYLQAYWPMPGDDSPEPDIIGTYDLTLTGSPTQYAGAPTVDDYPANNIKAAVHHLKMQGAM